MGALKLKNHKKIKLRSVVGSDLLTERERWIKQEVGGFYCLSDELAYCKGNDDKAQMTIPEFNKYLKEKIHPNFMVVYNDTITPKHQVQGHSVYFYVPFCEGYIPVCKIGRSADNILPANSVAKIATWKGDRFKKYHREDQEAILYRGWVATFEACKALYKEMERNGIEPGKIMTQKEIGALKMAYKVGIGTKDLVKKTVDRWLIEKFVSDIAHNETNLKYFQDETLIHKFTNKEKDSYQFLTEDEYQALLKEDKDGILENWTKLSAEEIKEIITDLLEKTEATKLEMIKVNSEIKKEDEELKNAL